MEFQLAQFRLGCIVDIVAVPGNPIEEISAVEHATFVMKAGAIVRE